jgi:hypothetical protein
MAMAKHLGLIVALSMGLVAPGASALTLQNFTAPDGGPQFADPDEKRPFSGDSGQKDQGFAAGQGFDMWRNPSSGLHFSFSGGEGNVGNPMFVPGLTVPNQFGPTYDPQTHDPYPR